MTLCWRVRVTSEADSCALRDRGGFEMRYAFVGYTPEPGCHSLVQVCLPMLIGVLCKSDGRNDGPPNLRQ